MSVHTLGPAGPWHLTCDGRLDGGGRCCAPGPVAEDAAEAVREARACGWRVLFNACLCPGCEAAGRVFCPLPGGLGPPAGIERLFESEPSEN